MYVCVHSCGVKRQATRRVRVLHYTGANRSTALSDLEDTLCGAPYGWRGGMEPP